MGRRVRRRIGALGRGVASVVALAAAACGTSEKPSEFGSYVKPFDGGSGQMLRIDAASTFEPMCNLGPEGGVCACTDEALAGDVPNLYFVLDRSGSMAMNNKWLVVQYTLDQLVIALGPRASIGAAAFPSPAGDSCSTGVEILATRRGDAPAGKPGPTESALVGALSGIPAAGGTPTAATLMALLPNLIALPGKTAVVLATDGGPNCDSQASCDASTCTANIDNTLNSGCTPTGPNCCTDPAVGAQLCLDSQPTIDAVAQFAAAGIPVYVVGVPGSQPYANLLDTLAVTGGTARGSEPQYYAVGTADQNELLAALSSIAAKVTGTCTLELSTVPPDPRLVNVFFDEQVVPEAGPDGWTLDGTTVTITGASCQKILDGAVLDVRVVAGCPTVAQ